MADGDEPGWREREKATLTSKKNHLLFRAAGWLAAPEGETLESTHELVTLLVAELKAHGNETRAVTNHCAICKDTGWTETPDVYPDGSMATSRRCPRGCSSEKASDIRAVDCTECPHPDACEAAGGCSKSEGDV